MALNNQFSIALHLMAGLGCRRGGDATSTDLATSVNACPSFVRRTLSKLSKAKLVRTTTGKSGACALAKDAGKISLLDVYRAVGAPRAFAIHHYPALETCQVSRNIKRSMEKVLCRAQKSMEESLESVSLAEFIADLRKG